MKNNLKLFFTIFLCYIPVFIAFACSMPQIDISDDSQEVLIRATARTAGYRFALNNPDQAELAKSHCDNILVAADPQAIVTEALTHLNDPILAATVSDLILLIKIKNSTDVYDREKLLVAVAAFKEGVEMAMEVTVVRWESAPNLQYESPDEYEYGGEDYPPIRAVLPPLPPGMFNDDYFVELGM